MKNDVRKTQDISTEMQINDLLYNIISDELEDMIADLMFLKKSLK